MKPDLSTLPADTDDNQLGAYLCRLWDEQRASGMVSGKWAPELGRFGTLDEWQKRKQP
jgi:hypothetical protein